MVIDINHIQFICSKQGMTITKFDLKRENAKNMKVILNETRKNDYRGHSKEGKRRGLIKIVRPCSHKIF